MGKAISPSTLGEIRSKAAKGSKRTSCTINESVRLYLIPTWNQTEAGRSSILARFVSHICTPESARASSRAIGISMLAPLKRQILICNASLERMDFDASNATIGDPGATSRFCKPSVRCLAYLLRHRPPG